ncbi:recombinase family protein [Clostridium botulinum]|uniref:recombinase family protein n=1 Tax=Clostridium botulinum TaxID=1491 RepID=UPI0002DCC9F0|nr:recombinase family protein [Clostridium botulinum]
MIFAYMRISTHKETQTTDRQRITLETYAKENKFEFDEIVEERVSGTIKANNREKYSKLKDKLRTNDILVITDLDRLGRNADDVIMELKELKSKGIRVIALDMPYMSDWNKANDSSIYDMVIDIVITIKAHMAQQEREKTVARINQGLDVARAKGKKLGRPQVELPGNFKKEYEKFKCGKYGDMTAIGFAKMLGIGRSTLYKYIKIYNEKF